MYNVIIWDVLQIGRPSRDTQPIRIHGDLTLCFAFTYNAGEQTTQRDYNGYSPSYQYSTEII